MFRICFIDDDEEFEIPLFRNVFGEAFDIVAATNYAELKSQINSRKGWMPDLFVLDLYFPCGPANRDEIEALRAGLLSLENGNAEFGTAYRNYLRAKVRLASVLEAWNQNANGGLKLAEKVAADYPKVPIVFYSRKATLEDTGRCMAAKNVWWVETKPTGKDPTETIELTKSAKHRITHRFEMVISKADSERVRRLKEAARVFTEFLGEFN